MDSLNHVMEAAHVALNWMGHPNTMDAPGFPSLEKNYVTYIEHNIKGKM